MTCHVKIEYVQLLRKRFSQVPHLTLRCPRYGQGWASYLKEINFTEDSRLVIATIGRRPHWFASAIGRVRYFVVLHNLNYCFDRGAYRKAAHSLKELVQDGRDYLRKPGKRRLFTQAEALLYPTEQLAQEGRQQFFLKGASHRVVPFAARRDCPKVSYSGSAVHPLKVIVPGSVTYRARDYDALIEALAVAVPSGAAIEIHLAGRIIDAAILQQLTNRLPHTIQTKVPSAVQVFSYPNGLQEEQFITLLASADILLAPLQMEVPVGRYRELLGFTKASGTPFDAIYYGKPLLLPHYHPLRDPAVVHFSDGTQLGLLLVEYANRRNFPTNCWVERSESALRDQWIEALGLPR